MRPKLVHAEARDGFRLYLRFADGAAGEVDLSGLIDRGVFRAWRDPDVWKAIQIDPVGGAPSWPGDIDLCPDMLYSEVSGKPLPILGAEEDQDAAAA